MSFLRKKYVINARGRRLVLGERTMVMGIVNLTPDSFSGDGRLARPSRDPARDCAYALRLIRDGADVIDIGGESTRPQAPSVNLREEIKRVIPVVERLRKKTDAVISVDTSKPEVAQRALDAGADMINNVMGLQLPLRFLKIIRESDAAFVVMHMRGNPRTMQSKTKYRSLVRDIVRELATSLEKCLDTGIKSDRIMIDPGIGFAKTPEQNLQILNELQKFRSLSAPLLVGTSRKSFIGKVLNAPVEGRIWGTAASVAAAIMGGAHMVRVHDVKEMKQVASVCDAILKPTAVSLS